MVEIDQEAVMYSRALERAEARIATLTQELANLRGVVAGVVEDIDAATNAGDDYIAWQWSDQLRRILETS